MSNNSLEIVHEGWLTKSPPSKPIWRARWRRRWFVLRHSGELPEQYFLEYYTDRNCRKLKGKIDLDQCEQVDAGLRFENRKQKYQHMFDVKTPKRIYYLAAESEEEMNKWVEYVCHVCGLKADKDEEDGEEDEEEENAVVQQPELEPALSVSTDSPPVSPTSSTISGPYIPISECISGKPLSSPNGLEDFNNLVRHGITATSQWRAIQEQPEATTLLPLKSARTAKRPPRTAYESVPSRDAQTSEFYDSPRKLHPPNLELRQGGSNTPPLQSPTTDAESVFTDDEWAVPVYPPPSVNWETFPSVDGDNIRQTRPSDSSAEVELSGDIGSWSVVHRDGKYTVVDNVSTVSTRILRQYTLPQPVAPPRPPKPSHLVEGPSHSYLNLENIISKRVPKAVKSSVTLPSSDCTSASDCAEEPPSPVSPPATEVIVTGVSDEMYDFPRSHNYANSASVIESEGSNSAVGKKFSSLSRHCYSNAAPGQVNGEVFRYDFQPDSQLLVASEGQAGEEPTSPHSEGSSSLASSTTAAIYSNLPSPLSGQSAGAVVDGVQGSIPTPPAVNRGLKPGRKLSDSASIASNEPSPGSPFTLPASVPYPPSVDRNLKPQRKFDSSQPEQGPIKLASPPACRIGSDGNRSLRKTTRAAPSPTPPSTTPTALRNGQRQRSEYNSSSDDDYRNSQEEEQIYYYPQDNHRFIPATHGKRLQEIQYLDLDLESDAGGSVAPTQTPKSPERVSTTGTVYKTVDFVKTEAFNRTRQRVEEERKQCSGDL
ncbi:protein daughter of sevenless isoform X2 [Anabrus simplex]|uniref:protein daughter of sevenless isoform X2 n=1 Tax=Anabrus simplex TaxID=316456 RepID=UPI0034DD2E94